MIETKQTRGLTRRSSRRNERSAKVMARIGQYKYERTSVNSFRWLHYENYQRRSLAPIR
jgi:hypothetical protein